MKTFKNINFQIFSTQQDLYTKEDCCQTSIKWDVCYKGIGKVSVCSEILSQVAYHGDCRQRKYQLIRNTGHVFIFYFSLVIFFKEVTYF